MKAIRILTKCAVGGQHMPAGKVCRVPKQVSADDAVRLLRLRRAEAVDAKADVKAETQ